MDAGSASALAGAPSLAASTSKEASDFVKPWLLRNAATTGTQSEADIGGGE